MPASRSFLLSLFLLSTTLVAADGGGDKGLGFPKPPGIRLCADVMLDSDPPATRELSSPQATVLFPGNVEGGTSETLKALASGPFYVTSTADALTLRSSLDNSVVRPIARASSAPIEIPAALSVDGEWLFTAAHEFHYVRLANTRTGQITRDGFGGGQFGAVLTFSPNGRYALFARFDSFPGSFVVEDLTGPSGDRYVVYAANLTPARRFIMTNKPSVVNLGRAFSGEIPTLQTVEEGMLGPEVPLPVSGAAQMAPPSVSDLPAVLDFATMGAAVRFRRRTATRMDLAERDITGLNYPFGIASPGGSFVLVLSSYSAERQFHVGVDVISLFARTRVARVEASVRYPVRLLAMDPDEQLVALGTAGEILVFDIRRPSQPSHWLRMPRKSPVTSLSFLDSNRLITTDGSGEVLRWDLSAP